MHNYSDTTAHTHHDEDKEQVMREVFCPFCATAARCSWLIVTGTSPCGIGVGTFALIFVKEVVSLKQWLLIYTQLAEHANIQGSRCCFQKNDANLSKAQGGKCL